MDLIENIIHYFKHGGKEKEKTSPLGTCPICWGYQQYDDKIRNLLKDRQVDINNHKDSYMLIQDFMKHNIDGVQLKEAVISDCPNCLNKDNKNNIR